MSAKHTTSELVAIQLKQPLHTYQPRLDRFFKLIERVRDLHPGHFHLWQIMDTAPFQDTETALKVILINHRMDNGK